MILHITNGDSAAVRIVQLRPGQRILPWRDILHEGPVPAGLSLRELNEIRAKYLFEAGYAEMEEALASFLSCEAALRLADEYGEIVLWFEHDLYDQLQLIQVLDWFRENAPAAPLRLIQTDDYLGTMPDAEFAACWNRREPVNTIHLDGAHMAWEAFRAAHPTMLGAMIHNRFPGLPHLAPALDRLCAEYPSARNGTSLTEELILRLAADGILEPGPMFEAYSKLEERIFLGDLSFFRIVAGLQSGPEPLLGSGLELTNKGRDVLDGNADRIDGNGIDRWIGGVHLAGQDSPWRWDSKTRRFSPRR